MVTTHYHYASFRPSGRVERSTHGLKVRNNLGLSISMRVRQGPLRWFVLNARTETYASADSPKTFKTLTAQMHCHCRDGVAFSSYRLRGEELRKLSGTNALEEIALGCEKESSIHCRGFKMSFNCRESLLAFARTARRVRHILTPGAVGGHRTGALQKARTAPCSSRRHKITVL